MSSPESATAVKPIDIARLQGDTDYLDKIKDEFVLDSDYHAASDYASKVQEGASRGLFERVAVDDTKALPDKNFGGLELRGSTAEAEEILASMRHEHQLALNNEREHEYHQRLSAVPPDHKMAAFRGILEDDVRRGRISFKTETTRPRNQQRAGQAQQAPVTRTTMSMANNAEGQASVWALSRLEAGLTPPEKTQLDQMKKSIAAEQAKLLHEHNADQARARAETLKLDRQARARERLEEAAAEKKDRKKGVKAADVLLADPRWDDFRTDMANSLLDPNLTKAQLAERKGIVDKTKLTFLARMNGRDVPTATDLDKAILAHVNYFIETPPDRRQKQQAADRQAAELEAFGKLDKDEKQQIIDDAHDEALASAEGADQLEQSRVYVDKQTEIDALGDIDPRAKALLEAQRDKAAGDVREEQAKRDLKIAKDKEDVQVVAAAKALAGRHESWYASVNAGDPHLRDRAKARRDQLNLAPVPFLETRSGGLFHRKKNRGPKMVESYFKAQGPGNDHLVVVERRKRRTGELVSQTVFTTDQPIRERETGRLSGPRHLLPPSEVMRGMADVRESDRVSALKHLKPKETGLAGQLRNTANTTLDYVNFGFGDGPAFNGPHGVYERYGADKTQLDAWKRKGPFGRRGGFWFWFTGDRR